MHNINVVTLGHFSLQYAVCFVFTKYVTDTMYIPYCRDVSESRFCHAKFCSIVPPHPLSVSHLTTLMHVSGLKSRLRAAPVN